LAGIEWMIEAFGCTEAALRDSQRMQSLFNEIVSEMHLKPVGAPVWHKFSGGGGVTGVWLLQESHLTLHSFPEYGSLCLNLFCCRLRFPYDWEKRLPLLVGAKEVEVREYPRIYDRQMKVFV
jgi:S-adenosylmethionine decarboxylase